MPRPSDVATTARRVAGALLAAWASVVPAAAAPAPPRVAYPDVVLVTLDTTRADALGSYGAPDGGTPTLDRLAAHGTRFARALTAAPLTLPAHASLLTGLDPPDHGVHDNGFAALPPAMPTLAEAFAAAGYATGAVVASAVLDHRFGLARGFAFYDDRLVAEESGEYGYPERDAAAVTEAALAWTVTLAAGRPYFLWVHYYDPHAPYADHGAEGGSDRRRYAGEVAFVDRQLALLLAALPGDPARRLVAVVGDHGEMLGEHGERAHGLLLYRSSLEVPLIVSGAGAPAGRVIEATVASRRLAASLSRLAGVEGRFGEPLPGLDGAPPGEDAVYSETWLPATAYGWSRLRSLTEGHWRYIEAPRPELYDLASDPWESRNLVAERPGRAADLRRRLARRVAESGAEAPPLEDAAALRPRLRQLGYLSGSSAGETGGLDPKDGVVLLAEFERAKELLAAGDAEQASARLEDLVRRNPSNVPFLMRAAEARLAGGDAARGVTLMERAAAVHPSFDLAVLGLARARLATGDRQGAEVAFRRALEINPRLAGAWLGRASLAAAAGEVASERRLLRAALDAGTLSAAIVARLGQLELEAGELATADELLGRATELAPAFAAAWWSWGELAERRGEAVLAAARYRRAVDNGPPDAAARVHLGRLLTALGRRDEAREMLESAARLADGMPAGREAARLLAALEGVSDGR